MAMDIARGKYYFTADVHLGSKDDSRNLLEGQFVDFLHSLPEEAKALFLLGDIFDFWVDYRDVVPRGYVRVLAALAELVDRGVEVFFYPGNHDWWVTDYFIRELGVKTVHECWSVVELDGRRICLGHGDIPQACDFRSKLIFRLFHSRFWIGVLRTLHPRLSFGLARKWSASSRSRHPESSKTATAEDVREFGLYRFAEGIGRKRAEAGEPAIDYFIFGHIHTPARIPVDGGGEFVVIGDWADGPQYFCL